MKNFNGEFMVLDPSQENELANEFGRNLTHRQDEHPRSLQRVATLFIKFKQLDGYPNVHPNVSRIRKRELQLFALAYC